MEKHKFASIFLTVQDKSDFVKIRIKTFQVLWKR